MRIVVDITKIMNNTIIIICILLAIGINFNQFEAAICITQILGLIVCVSTSLYHIPSKKIQKNNFSWLKYQPFKDLFIR